MFKSSLSRKAALWVCGKPLGRLLFYLTSRRTIVVWILLVIAWERVLSSALEGLNRNCSNFLSPYFPQKAIKFVAPLCAKLISIWR